MVRFVFDRMYNLIRRFEVAPSHIAWRPETPVAHSPRTRVPALVLAVGSVLVFGCSSGGAVQSKPGPKAEEKSAGSGCAVDGPESDLCRSSDLVQLGQRCEACGWPAEGGASRLCSVVGQSREGQSGDSDSPSTGWTKRCRQGCKVACFVAGLLKFDVSDDVPRGIRTFRKGCARGHARSCYTMGILRIRDSKPGDTVLAGKFDFVREYFEKGCKRDGGRSCAALIKLDQAESLWEERRANAEEQIEYRKNHPTPRGETPPRLWELAERAGTLEYKISKILEELEHEGRKYIKGQKSLLRDRD